MKKVAFIFALLVTYAFGQGPSHFTIGENELADIHVYDLYQDAELNYWVASNNGIYKYDGYDFTLMECPDMVSHSVFYLCGDGKGSVYCNNLNGQIFQLKDDSCRLYFQIPDSLMYHTIVMGVDADGTITIATKALFRVNDNKTIKILIPNNSVSSFSGSLMRNYDEEMMLFNSLSSEIMYIKNGEIRYEPYSNPPKYLYFMKYRNMVVSYDGNSGLKAQQNGFWNDFYSFEPGYRRVYSDGEYIWNVNPSGGAQIFGYEGVVLKNTVISAVIRDKEGNVLIGTFGEGIKVIPNMKVWNFEFDNDRPTSVSTDKQSAYIGMQSGRVYHLNNTNIPNQIRDKGEKMVEEILYASTINKIIVDDISAYVLGSQGFEKDLEGIGAIKDVYQVKTERFLVASNLGTFELTIDESGTRFDACFGYLTRTNSIAFDSTSNTYYAGEARGLAIGTKDKMEAFELDGQAIISRDIWTNNGTAYVCTQNNGILIFEGSELKERWNTETGLPSNQCKQILPYYPDYFINTNQGVYVINTEGAVKCKIGPSKGVMSGAVSDMAIQYQNDKNAYLFLIYDEGIQKFYIPEILGQIEPPELFVDGFYVNEKLQANTEKFELASDQNRIKIDLKVKTLKLQKELSYEYKLSEIDEEWQVNDYQDHIIEYKSVPPGDYTFSYRVKFQDQKGPINKVYFAISKPFWSQWWFYLFILLVLIAVGYVVYRYQLKAQKKKADFQRELIASKLTAIQSQMNPHFIFNSLNSIQDLVLKQEGNKAYDYISKFAYLVRKVLHFSDAELIDLEEEMKVLEVYLELEQLRFSKDFEYNVVCEDQENLQIPPMIVQPFVENALKHGLLHKKGLKKLSVEFDFKDNKLTCRIEDNGVGRARSGEINRRKSQQHESFSVKSIRSRFDILKSKYGGELGVEFQDLYENGEARGTVVTLQLPFRNKF